MSPVSNPLRPVDFASDVLEVVRTVPERRPLVSMLEAECVQVQDATVVDFKSFFWDRMTEL